MAAYRPSQEDLVVYIGSFGFNRVVYSTPSEASDGGMRYLPMDIREAWQTPVYLDSIHAASAPTASDEGPPAAEGCTSGNCNGLSTVLINRHEGGVNCLFLDWSVRAVGLKELWTLKWYDEFDTHGRWTKAGGVQPEDWPKWMRNFKEY